MCGIAGVIAWRPIPDGPVRRMVAAMRHRGPDDAGVDTPASGVVLGGTRLSILDLSSAAHQPMADDDGHVRIVFNGEIYNFRELRRDLEARNHRFRSSGDTEVVLRAYLEWGPECLRRLRGMFAFAVFDGRRRGPDGAGPAVLLARDHLGIKPLHFTVRDGVVAFASEVRALLASRLVPRVLSPHGVAAYLLWGSVAEPLSLIEGIRSLPPGHRMLVRLGSASFQAAPQPYWSLDTRSDRSRTASISAQDLRPRVRALLEETVGLHLSADVPVGVFLSGGVDSTAIATLAARAHDGIDTVSVVFPDEPAYSEALLTRRTARRLGARHHEVALTAAEVLRRLDEAVAGLDQPSMDGINTYFVSWGAKQAGLTVALSGLGGDELFGGYPTFVSVPRLEVVAALAGRLPRPLRAPAAHLGSRLGVFRGDAAQKLLEVVAHPDLLPHPYVAARGLFTMRRLQRLLNGTGEYALTGLWRERFEDVLARARGADPSVRVSALELQMYLVNTLLRDTDAMSMAHSLEVRVPFVDRVLVEALIQVPNASPVWAARRGLRSKKLLVDALADILPADIGRQRKRTFTFPWALWLREPLRRRVLDSLGDLAVPLRPYLSPVGVRSVGRDFLAGRTGWARPWALYVLNDWVRRHVGT
jgi:asparagine synthase (glutamine-hydrolysing)